MNDPMYRIFTTVLNLSVTASVALLAVLLLRPALRRAPKAVTTALWFAPLFRLLCPVSFSSVLSVFALLGQRGAPQPVPMDIGAMAQPQVDLFVPPVSRAVSQALPAATPFASVNPMYVYMMLGALVWITGALIMALWGVFSYVQLKSRLRNAVRDGDVWRTEHAGAPFLAGLLRPRIYVPVGLIGEPLALILGHERAHLRHGDPWVKLLWYGALCVHWFNPLVWLAFHLVTRDMELHADEAALRPLEPCQRAAYADALLNLCKPRRTLGAPLAFGESGAAGRIRRALSYKRPAFWIIVTAAALAVAALVALVANPLEKQTNQNAGNSAGLAAKLYTKRTPYIGDNSKVGAILNLLPYPDGVKLSRFELQTKDPPYGVIVQMTADSAYHREDTAQLLQWERSAAVLFALVGNDDWVRFDVTQDSKPLQYLFKEETVNNTNPAVEDIRTGDGDESALTSLILEYPSFMYSYFDVQTSDNSFYLVNADEDAALRELFHAYALTADTAQAMPQANGYTVTFRYSEALAGGIRLRIAKEGNQVYGQMDDGPVRELAATLYQQVEELYTKLAARPVQTANATAAPMGEHYELALLSYGKEVASQTEFNSEAQYLMDSIFFDLSIRSSAWPGVDVSALETCYRIRIYLNPAQPTELYVFRKDGTACSQMGKKGMYTGLKEELYQQVAAMLPTPAETKQ